MNVQSAVLSVQPLLDSLLDGITGAQALALAGFAIVSLFIMWQMLNRAARIASDDEHSR